MLSPGPKLTRCCQWFKRSFGKFIKCSTLVLHRSITSKIYWSGGIAGTVAIAFSLHSWLSGIKSSSLCTQNKNKKDVRQIWFNLDWLVSWGWVSLLLYSQLTSGALSIFYIYVDSYVITSSNKLRNLELSWLQYAICWHLVVTFYTVPFNLCVLLIYF